MTIVKLILIEDRPFRYDPENISYHINTHVADKYAKRMIKNGTTKTICNGKGDIVKIPVKFLEDYRLEFINVNEED